MFCKNPTILVTLTHTNKMESCWNIKTKQNTKEKKYKRTHSYINRHQNILLDYFIFAKIIHKLLFKKRIYSTVTSEF